MAASLDIEDLQVLVRHPTDPKIQWHHRILLQRNGEAWWIALSPDLQYEHIDLAVEEHRILERNRPFPQDIKHIYAFDPMPSASLDRFRREAALQVFNRLFFSLSGTEAKGENPQEGRWIFSDMSSAGFGEAVPQALVDDVNVGFCSVDDRGIVRVPAGCGRHAGQPVQYLACRLVQPSRLAEWRETLATEDDDVRLLGIFQGRDGKRAMSLDAAMLQLKERAMPHWSFEGPRVCLELLKAVHEGPGNLVSYHSEWIRLSGVQQNSAAAHEHRHCCELLRLGIEVDQVHVTNLACFEQIARRLVQLEAENPSAPDVVDDGC